MGVRKEWKASGWRPCPLAAILLCWDSRQRLPTGVREKRRLQARRDMRILLQDVRKKLFFRHRAVWTSNPDAAFEFREAHELFQFVKEHGLRDVQAVLVLDNPSRVEVVPLEQKADS